MNIPSILKPQFIRQTPNPTYADLQQLGRAVAWRVELFGALPVTRSRKDPFPLLIYRQVEDELDRYQREINDLADELQTGAVDDEEFQRRLRNLTIAILLLAFLRGSQIKDNDMINQALEVLRGGGRSDIEVDYTRVPDEAIEELQSEIETSITAAAGLATAILTGRYEDRGGTLASRLAMWATTALGIYALGQLYRADIETRMQWLWGATIEHCRDCVILNGQVHTIAEWLAFFQVTGKRPGSRALACGGWQCLCGTYETGEQMNGKFVWSSEAERKSFEIALKSIVGDAFDLIEDAM